jgi:hypothetical protein
MNARYDWVSADQDPYTLNERLVASYLAPACGIIRAKQIVQYKALYTHYV